MKILVIGGAGRVARWTVPHLRRNHDVTTFDRVAPADVIGDAMAPDEVAAAMAGMDAVVDLAVVVPRGDAMRDPDTLRAAWAVNVGSWWVALEQGRLAGVRRFVYGSTMSVHARFGAEPMPDPSAPAPSPRDASADEPSAEEAEPPTPDATMPYPFSKRVGEAAGQLYAAQFGLHVTALRLAFPTTDEAAPLWIRPATGEPSQVVRPDGVVMPAAPAALIAERIERALTFDGEFQVDHVAAPGTPWA